MEIPVRRYAIDLCDACMRAEGSECHTPGCALWLNRVPDLPLTHNVFVCPLGECEHEMAARSDHAQRVASHYATKEPQP